MDTFFDAAFGFPAVIFTILLVPVVLYWFTGFLGVVDIDLGGDADIDMDVDVDADVGVGEAADAGDAAEAGDADGGPGPLASWWQALGLAGVPVTVAVSFVVVFGWFVSLLATGLVESADLSGLTRFLLGVVTLLVAVVAGMVAASVMARPLVRLFATEEAEHRQAFVGRTCVVRTTTVTGSFGQAEASDGSGATVLLQVRVTPGDDGADLRRGSVALIVDYDPVAEVFAVCPVDDVLGAAEPGP